jgi:hypothetical protein
VTARPNPWDGEWDRRIYERVRARDYSSVTGFAEARPGASYGDLARELGDDIAVAQLETLLRNEATKGGFVERFGRGSLVRLLREYCPEGWGSGNDFTFRAARAFATWVSTLGDEYQTAAERTWGILKARQPPQGWLPTSADDPFLKAVFTDALFGEEASA